MERRTPLQEAVAAASAELRTLRRVCERARVDASRARQHVFAGVNEGSISLLSLVSAMTSSTEVLYLCYRCITSEFPEAAPGVNPHNVPPHVLARLSQPIVLENAVAALATRPRPAIASRAAL